MSKALIARLIEHCGKFAESGGILDSAFKSWHMKEIKTVEEQLIPSSPPEIFVRLLDNANAVVRERSAFILGEVLKQERISAEERGTCVARVARVLSDPRRSTPERFLTELINAVGKSGVPEAENQLLPLLSDPRAKRVRMFVLVALAKTGGETSVLHLSQFSRRSDLRISDLIFVPWAYAKLASLTRARGPLSRSLFADALRLIRVVLGTPVRHHQLHMYCVFAAGEICDRRWPDLINGEIEASDVKRVHGILERMASGDAPRDRLLKGVHAVTLAKLASAALSMLQGIALSDEQERILLELRNLLVPVVADETIKGDANIKALLESVQPEPVASNQKAPQKARAARTSIEDFFDQ